MKRHATSLRGGGEAVKPGFNKFLQIYAQLLPHTIFTMHLNTKNPLLHDTALSSNMNCNYSLASPRAGSSSFSWGNRAPQLMPIFNELVRARPAREEAKSLSAACPDLPAQENWDYWVACCSCNASRLPASLGSRF